MASKYFIQKGDQTFGPMSGSDVKTLALSGKLMPKDLVWQEGLHLLREGVFPVRTPNLLLGSV